MKRADRIRFATSLRSTLPFLHGRGPLLEVLPRGRVLRGVYLEGSSFNPGKLRAWAFVQPLFVPASSIVLTLGVRIGGNAAWGLGDESTLAAALAEEGRVHFETSTPSALLELVSGLPGDQALEVKAYTLVAERRFGDGADCLDALAAHLSAEEPLPWRLAVRERATHLASLARTNPEAALEQLVAWEA